MHVIGLVDGAFPSDMALSTPTPASLDEQRLFYVALTRARDQLTLYTPLRMPHQRYTGSDRHTLAPASRFLTDARSPHSTSPKPYHPHRRHGPPRPRPCRYPHPRRPLGIAARLALPTLDRSLGPSRPATVGPCSTRRSDVSDAATYRDLAEAAWSWTLDQVRDDDGPWLPESVDEGEPHAAAALGTRRPVCRHLGDRTRARRGGTAPTALGAGAAPRRPRGRSARASVPHERRAVALRWSRRNRDRAAAPRAGGRTGRAAQDRRAAKADGMDLARTRSVPRHGAHRHHRRDCRDRAQGSRRRWRRRSEPG